MKPFQFFGADGLPLIVVIPAAIGNVLWIILYVILLLNARKSKFIEMPLFIIAGNLCWEVFYGFIFPPDPILNPLIQWGVRAWAVLDMFIFLFAYKYVDNEVSTPLIRQYIAPIMVGLFITWGAVIWSIAAAGGLQGHAITNEDLVKEAMSAMILNIVISFLYIYQYLRLYNQQVFLSSVAWLKMLGTGLTTVATMFNKPFNEVLATLGIIIFIADITYIVLWYKLPNVITNTNAKEA